MRTVTSADGTEIAYERLGEGPTLILVDGAMCTHATGSKPELVQLLAAHFTVFSFDRRGRGESGDNLPYAVEREVEDIEALIGEAGATAFLFGHSSGGALTLAAALQLGTKVEKLAMYEVPYNDDVEVRGPWRRYIDELTVALAANRRGDALALFMSYVETPAEEIAAMRHSPMWAAMESLAPTLAYDHAYLMSADLSVPTERAAEVRVPTLVMYGDASFPFMATTARTLSHAIPGAELCTLAGQTHHLRADPHGVELAKFLLR